MILNNLEQLHQQILNNNDTFCIFPFAKNKIVFNILFDIGTTPFKLVLLQKKGNFRLELVVTHNYNIDSMLDRELYKQLCEVLDLTNDSNNRFSTNAFFSELNTVIPRQYYRSTAERPLYVFYSNNIEEPNKLYYSSMTDWKNTLNRKNHKVTDKNLEKTRVLYPEIYEFCKDNNISVNYTSENIKKDLKKDIYKINRFI
ncbi:hypothetical protein HX049_00065 [Myroides odoratimimus]|uniref:DUF6037 family protein n=1 Tax=Myroides odoratimimus TaxID=76832 RepID=UPI002577BE4F|nr:DUF6037 family protein [Myroides odoratimimus]MDM1395585.1 hypothetical protein [Myroides odoratimimus]